MRYTFVGIIVLAVIQAVASFDLVNDDQHEEETRQAPSGSLFYSSLPFDKAGNAPECLLKSQLLNMVNRERRASISRPYFHHWRPARESSRYSSKNSLAFSPRLGKRSLDDEPEVEEPLAARSVTDLDTFLVTLVDHLKGKKIDIVYEDSTKICLSQAISDALMQQVLSKFDANRRNLDEQDKEEARGKQVMGKHPVLFRYRLG